MDSRPQLHPMWKPYAETARALGARLTSEALGPGRSAGRLDELARRLQRELDRMIQQTFDSLPGGAAPACSAGCDHCCRTLPVMVSPIEVFSLARRIGGAYGDEPATRARVVAAAAHRPATAVAPDPAVPPDPAVAPDSALAARPLSPCPLLGEGGLCVVYSSRPLACRGCVSADASACATCGETGLVPRSTPHQLGAAAMMRGVSDALDSLGLVGTLTDIRPALVVALDHETAEKRWLRGDDVFAGLA